MNMTAFFLSSLMYLILKCLSDIFIKSLLWRSDLVFKLFIYWQSFLALYFPMCFEIFNFMLILSGGNFNFVYFSL